ncbi:hypothetical protein FRC12_019830 [Ceratobasidium sp. 428]|nr:hypothetical protein FRC12_019830 [Ceratobasidium sp. 428]
MSLVGYHIAHLWVKEQEETRSRQDTGPTPLQYGLMLQVLSASSIMSLSAAVRYLFKGKLRPRVPSYFRVAVTMGLIVYVVTHFIGLADLWLHATTTAVLHNLTSVVSDSEPLLTSLVFNETNCEEFDYPPQWGVCMSRRGGRARDLPWLVDAGELAVSNSLSDRAIIITLAEADNMALLSHLRLCRRDTVFYILANCSNLGITAIPSHDGSMMSAALVDSIHPWNGSAISLSDSGLREGFIECCGTNPIKSLLQLRWPIQNAMSGATTPNDAVDLWPTSALTLLASCSIEIFNVTLQYDGTTGVNNWALDPAGTVPSDERFATILIGPFSWQMISNRLANNIRARAMVARDVQDVMAALNQELARLALGFIAGSFVLAPATDVQILTPTILGRYPLVPLLTFTGLLALYGLIALLVFAMSSFTTTGSIHVPSELRGKPKDKNVPELKLVQLRLLNPLTVIAQQFSEYQFPTPNASDPDGRSVKTSAMDLFPETGLGRMEIRRLRLGLERGSVRPRYGVWKNE